MNAADVVSLLTVALVAVTAPYVVARGLRQAARVRRHDLLAHRRGGGAR